MKGIGTVLLCIAALLSLAACQKETAIDYSGPTAGWEVATGTSGGGQYSPLTQIDKQNVTRLQVAWTYSSTDFMGPGGYGAGKQGFGGPSSRVSVNPIIANGKMVICTPLHRVVALDPETGKELWNFDPKMDLITPSHACRGVAVWSEPPSAAAPDMAPSGSAAPIACRQRVLSYTGDGRLFAVDLASGKLCAGFGENGMVNMKHGLGPMKQTDIYQTSAPLVVGDLVVTGMSVRDGFDTQIVGGGIRAYDARSGKLAWVWDSVPPGMHAVTAAEIERGATLTRGTPNAWTTLSADLKNGLIFVPTGNPSVDYYKGKERSPMSHYGSSVVALRATTGEVVWNFQIVHHDLWDYDTATQPALYDHRGPNGEVIPALAVASKPGHIFLLNRLTGQPLFPVEERPVPQSDVPGEWTSPTQPFPTRPAPVFKTPVTKDDLIDWPFVSAGCAEQFAALRNEGMFTPPSLQKTIQFPANPGGFNWGGMAIDPASGTMVSTYLRMLFRAQLVPNSDKRSGAEDNDPVNWSDLPQHGTPYRLQTGPLLSKRGMPCLKPPWGVIVAYNLWTGEKLWEKPLGDLGGYIPIIGRWLNVGVPLMGGPIQTATGLTFIGASSDRNFRAFDAATGKVLWSTRLPYSAYATPMTYRLSPTGKQYIVIATGGNALFDGDKVGNTLVAYALPD